MSRQLCIPKLLLSINDEKNIISHVSILETCVILLSDNILLLKPFIDSNNSNNNVENETIIIDDNHFIGSYAAFYNNTIEMIYTISLSGSLYSFCRNNNKDKFIINKLFELPYHKYDKDKKPIIYLDTLKALLVIICPNMIYFLTLDFNKLDQGNEAVLGVVSFPFQQKNIYPDLKNNEILPKDIIYYCNVWGSENKEMVVCSGNGTWLDIWPLKPVYEDGFLAWELEYPNFEAIRFASDHTSWITSLSKQTENSKSSLYVTGDAEGEIQFWRCKKRNRIDSNDKNQSSILQKLFKCSTANTAPITSIIIDGTKIWVGDDTGGIRFYQVDTRNEKIINLKSIETGNISGPTDFHWIYHTDRSEGRLRSFSSHGGTLYEYILHDSIVTVMKAWPDPSSVYWHKSQLEVCSLIDEWDLLITAGSGNAIFLWDISTCKLLSTIPSPDNFCTSLASFCERKIDKNVVRIFIGHSNGHTQEYSIIMPNIDMDVTVSSGQSNSELEKFSLMSKLSNDAPEMIQMDILDVVQLEPSTQNDQSIIQNDTIANDNLLTAILPPPILNKSLDASIIMPEPIFELICTTEYCPMPVTDILISDLGYYVAYFYARRCLIIHDCRNNLALAQLQFDDSLIDISKITRTNNIYIEQDSFIIILLGKTTLKLLDGINNNIVASYDLNPLPHGEKIIYSVIWDSIISSNMNLHKIQGIILTHGLGIYSFDDLNGCRPLKQKHLDYDEKISLEHLVCGIKSHDYNESPLTSIWMMRKLILLRLKLLDSSQQNNDENIQIVKSFEYNVDDIKTRIIFSKSLKAGERTTMYRSIVVLSDGTVCVLRI
jgi:hypothetical protein